MKSRGKYRRIEGQTMNGRWENMRWTDPFIIFMSTLVLTVGTLGGEQAEPSRATRNERVGIMQNAPSRVLLHSSGRYMGHAWRIDKDHLIWWDGKPYVRFGFTGNGDPAQMLRAGFDQFGLMPAEEWPISGPDPKIIHSVNETSEQLEKAGATYYGTLNAFWPWRYGNLIAESDKAPVFVRDVRDITKYSGRRLALNLQVRLPIHKVEQDKVTPIPTHAVLFDLDRGTHHDLRSQLESVAPFYAEPGLDARREGDEEQPGGMPFRVRFKPTHFPKSTSLRLVVAMEVRLGEVPGANGLPPLWNPGIREFYRCSLEAFRPAYAKPGLRGLQFGDEINPFPLSLLTARTYLDLRRDAVALKAYWDWLGGLGASRN